jgi:glycosyltransferase involved in cell wall biosynthesis
VDGRQAPMFSVIIPTYNRSRHVVEAVESVLAQRFDDFDVWVIDDGSTDATVDALHPYIASIRYLRQPNRGHAAARNRGIRESSGSYLAFLDSDDRWHPDKLGRFAEAIQRAADVGLLYSDVTVVTYGRQPLWVQRARRVDGGDGYLALLRGNFITMSSVVVSRAAVRACGLFDEHLRLSPDWDLWIRIARRFPVAHVPFPLTEYSALGADSQSADASEDWAAELQYVIAKALAADPATAREHSREIIARLNYAIGRTLLLQGSRRTAISAFGTSIRLRPTLWRPYVYLALTAADVIPRLPRRLKRILRLPH